MNGIKIVKYKTNKIIYFTINICIYVYIKNIYLNCVGHFCTRTVKILNKNDEYTEY